MQTLAGINIPLTKDVPHDIHQEAYDNTQLFQSDDNVISYDQNIVYHDKVNKLGIRVTDEISHITESDLNLIGFSFQDTIITVKKNLGTILYTDNLDLLQYLSDMYDAVLLQNRDKQYSLVQDAMIEKIEDNPVLH